MASIVLVVYAAIYVSGCGASSKLIGVSITASSSNVDGSDSVTLTATVANDKRSAGVTWSVASGGGTLSNQTTTSATYTAPAATSSQQTIIITATSVAKKTQTGTVTLTVPAKPTVTSTSANLTGGVGSAFSITLQASGGIPPYTWALGSSTTLPTCLTLKSDGTLTTTSRVAPTASCAGTYSNLTFTATDSGTPTPLSVTSPPLTITIAAAPAVTFTGVVPTAGTYGVAFSGSAAATGGAGALTYSIAAGALPTDLSLNTSTGAITGTPGKAADVGTFNFTVKAADAYGDSNTQAYSIVVSYPAVAVNAAALPTGYVGSVYTSTTLAATGGNGGPYSWTWTAATGSSLPAGLSLSTGGAITGTPTTAGTYSVVTKATDSASNSGAATLAITVKAGVSITTSTTLPAGYVGSNYSQQLAASGSGSGYTWTVTSGSNLPAGLTLSATGLLSGAPTTSGAPGFNLTVTDSAGNKASATFTITISVGISVTAPTVGPAYPGMVYTSAAFTANGGSGTGYAWSWAAASGSTLPNGLSIGSTTGIISGTPANSGNTRVTSNVVVTATDSVGNKGSATVSITIEATVTITTLATLPAGTVAVVYSQTLAASGGSGTGYTWSTDTAGTTSLAGIGLALAANGALTGASPTMGTATFTATVTDSQGHAASAPLSLTINNQLKINQTTLKAADQGSAYSQTLTASGGSGTGYTFSATGSNLSSFVLTLASSGTVSGTPTGNGTASFTANVKDSNNNTATQALTITIYGVLSLPTPNPSSLPSGYTNIDYTGSVTGSGGSNSLSIAVTTALSPANGTLAIAASGATVNVTGKPTTAATESFGVTLSDTITGSSIGQTYTIAIAAPTPVSLPAPNPSSLPSAIVNQSYIGAVNASGGVAPYIWSINGTTVTSGGISVGNGLSASSTGGSTLSIAGTPTTTTTVTLANVKVVDSASTNAMQTYTIAVNSAGQSVSGIISPSNSYCGNIPALPTITVTINTNPQQQVQTDSTGAFTFSNVPNGTYTITPSISGPSSMFYPATQAVSVSGSKITGENFSVKLGYTVSGTLSYSGANTGQIYVNLINLSCGGLGGSGTNIASAGSFTIRGVAPGLYSVQAWMDLSALAEGIPNTSDPTGTNSSNFTVSTANVTGESITLTDPTVTVGTTAPKIKTVAPMDSGVVISFGAGPFFNGKGSEVYTSYTVQWSTNSSSGFASSNQAIFKAVGRTSNVWIVRNGNSNMTGSLNNGTAYYFKIWGSNAAGNSPVTITPVAVAVGAPTAGNTVSGTIYIPSSVTINPGVVLYAGLYDGNSNTAYADIIAAPVNTSGGNAFTVHVPNGSSYTLFGILDQNQNGVIDVGDITNVNRTNNVLLTVSGNLTGQNLTLPSINSLGAVATQFIQSSATAGSYGLNFDIQQINKLPVAVTLMQGPNAITPADFSNYCPGCASIQFQQLYEISDIAPTVGDTYTFAVKYSDGSSDSNVTAKVIGWNGGTSVAGPGELVTSMLPNGNTGPNAGTRTQPTFTWTDPAADSSDSFAFTLYDSTTGASIWLIPGPNASSASFSSGVTSITWGVDPTDGTNTPSVTSLTAGNPYTWYIAVWDSNNNEVIAFADYTP